MNGSFDDIATHSYTNIIEVDELPHLRVILKSIVITVEVTGREYIATLRKTYNHHKVNVDSMQKSLTLKKCKLSGEYFYYFTWKIRKDKVKRKHLKKSDWCYFCNYANPCDTSRIGKLKANSWTLVDEKLVRVLNAAKSRNPELKIYWADWNLWS